MHGILVTVNLGLPEVIYILPHDTSRPRYKNEVLPNLWTLHTLSDSVVRTLFRKSQTRARRRSPWTLDGSTPIYHSPPLSKERNPGGAFLFFAVAMLSFSATVSNQIRLLLQSLNDSNFDSIFRELCQVCYSPSFIYLRCKEYSHFLLVLFVLIERLRTLESFHLPRLRLISFSICVELGCGFGGSVFRVDKRESIGSHRVSFLIAQIINLWYFLPIVGRSVVCGVQTLNYESWCCLAVILLAKIILFAFCTVSATEETTWAWRFGSLS